MDMEVIEAKADAILEDLAVLAGATHLRSKEMPGLISQVFEKQMALAEYEDVYVILGLVLGDASCKLLQDKFMVSFHTNLVVAIHKFATDTNGRYLELPAEGGDA